MVTSQALLFLAVAALSTSDGQASNSYMVLFPRDLYLGRDYDVLVTVLKPNTITNTVMINVYNPSQNVVHFQSFQLPTVECLGSSCSTSGVVKIPIPDNFKEKYYTVEVKGSTTVSNYTESMKVYTKPRPTNIFIQLDKAQYKPGQTVRFRVILTDENLKPVAKVLEIDIQDPKSNRIKQIRDTTSAAVYVGTLKLSDEPMLGVWTIKVKADELQASKKFEVREYVLPRFEVKVTPPGFLLTFDREISVTIDAGYTYGKPVVGMCELAVYGGTNDIHKSAELVNGKVDVAIKMDNIYAGNIYTFSATCTETLTEKAVTKNATVRAYSQKFTLTMDGLNTIYRPGMVYNGIASIKRPDGSPPLPSDLLTSTQEKRTVKLTLSRERYLGYPNYQFEKTELANTIVEVGNGGKAIFQFNMNASWAEGTITLKAMFYDGVYNYTGQQSLQQFYAQDGFLQLSLSGDDGTLQPDRKSVFNVTTTFVATTFQFMFSSRGRIVFMKTIHSNTSRQHLIEIPLSRVILGEMSPSARVSVWTISEAGEIIADAINLKVVGAANDQVSLKISPKKGALKEENSATTQPGAPVTVSLQTPHAQADVYYVVVDKAVTLLGDYSDVTLTLDKVESTLENQDPYSRCGGGFYDYPRYMGGPHMPYYPQGGWCGGMDVENLFENTGYYLKSDFYLYFRTTTPMWTTTWQFTSMATFPASTTTTRFTTVIPGIPGAPGIPGIPGIPGPTPPIDTKPTNPGPIPTPTLRSDFRDSWLYGKEITGSAGSVSFEAVVPDSITTWLGSAFSISTQGGLEVMANPFELTAFKPFFVDVDLPYSIIRGEQFELRIVLQNYLKTSANVMVSLKKSTDFKVSGAKDTDYVHAEVRTDIQIGADAGLAISVWINPVVLGNVPIQVEARSSAGQDAVLRKIIVKPEGVPQEESINGILQVPSGQQQEKLPMRLLLPMNKLVSGSLRVEANAIGDIMGQQLTNLDRLIQMPYGCGEQNMLNFAPNIFIMNYLQATGQLTQPIKAKITDYTRQGYQRELGYKRLDGCYSAFGEMDGAGSSTWLTAFVVRTYREAIDILDTDVTSEVIQSTRCLLTKQVKSGTETGVFKEYGIVRHKDMQGGTSSGLTMTGYVVITLLEIKDLFQDPMRADLTKALDMSLKYLLDNVNRTRDNPYVLAIVAYALALDRHTEAINVYNMLKQLAVEEDGLMYWKDKQIAEPPVGSWSPPYQKAAPLSVEIASYALLTFIQHNDVFKAIPIMRWLVLQRNPTGGFRSTQDTIMGLQSLAELGSKVYSVLEPNMELGVLIKEINEVKIFPQKITRDNQLILQALQLNLPERQVNELEVIGTGTGTAFVQVTAKYNIKTPEVLAGLKVNVTSTQVRNGTVHTDICARYLNEGASGMVIVSANPISGFKFPFNELNDLFVDVSGLKRMEMQGEEIVLYLDAIDNKGLCVTLRQERYNFVTNLQPVEAKAYLYYNPDLKDGGLYLPPQLAALQTPCQVYPLGCTDDDDAPTLQFILEEDTPTSAGNKLPPLSAILVLVAVLINAKDWRN